MAGMIGAIEGVTGRGVEVVTGKPSPITVQEALRLIGLEASDCIVVGDRLETDIRMGVESGMATALVLTGCTSRSQVVTSHWQPEHILDSVAGLMPTFN